MLRIVRFLPLVLVVLFVAWCSSSRERQRETGPQRTELVELFLSQGLIANAQVREGELSAAARKAGRTGMNQLLYAAAPGATIDALQWIVRNGAEPGSVGSPEGLPLLHKAAQTPSRARLDYFLSLGLDPKQRAAGGNTLLHTAVRAGIDDGVLQILLSKGLKLADANQAGQLPIHLAGVKSIDTLARNGAEVDAVDAQGRSALHQAAADRRADLVTELLRVGASVFKADGKGRTPLHLAALARDERGVDLLLAAGAPRSARDADGLTARDLAQSAQGAYVRSRGLVDKL